MTTEHNIHLQIAELERERTKRNSVFPKLVSKGKMRQSEANECNGRLDAALTTLRWCRDNRELIAEVQRRAAPAEGGAQ